MTMTDVQRYKLAMKGDMKMLRDFFSGVPIESLRNRYGCSEKRIRQLAKDYREGKIDIFEVRDQKKITMSMMTHKEQVDVLQMKIKSLEEALKMAKIKAEGYEYMLDLLKEEYGVDLLKKVEAGQSRRSKRGTRK